MDTYTFNNIQIHRFGKYLRLCLEKSGQSNPKQ